MIAMAILIGTALLLWLACTTYRAGRQLLSRTPRRNLVLRHILDDTDSEPGLRPDDAAEAREAEFTRQLLSGRLDAADYQRAMTDLAHPGTTRSGGMR